MITPDQKLCRYSKNMATINYWMREQNFVRYDSLFWQDNGTGKLVTLHFSISEVVAEVNWYTIMRDGEEFHVPFFVFKGQYAHWSGNQTMFWIGRHLNLALQGGAELDSLQKTLAGIRDGSLSGQGANERLERHAHSLGFLLS